MKIRYRYIIGLRLREAAPNSLPKYPKCEDFCDFADICYRLEYIRYYGCSISTAIKYTEKGEQFYPSAKIKWIMRAGFPSDILGKAISKMDGRL